MGDSEDEREGSDPGIDLTGFLFGNIDESGQLEDDVLDSESKRHLASLGRMGLSSMLREVIDAEQITVKSESDSDEDERKVHDRQDLRLSSNSVKDESKFSSHPGGPVVIILATGSEVHGFKPDWGRWIFSEHKNPEYDFLWKGSKAMGPVP